MPKHLNMSDSEASKLIYCAENVGSSSLNFEFFSELKADPISRSNIAFSNNDYKFQFAELYIDNLTNVKLKKTSQTECKISSRSIYSVH